MRGYFTTRRGRVKSRSDKQHRFLHWQKIDHTHVIIDKYGKRHIRHSWVRGTFKRHEW